MNVQNVLTKAGLNREVIAGVFVINQQGRLIMADIPLPANTSSDFSHSEYFIFHANHAMDSLFITKPFVSSSKAKPVLVISRRLSNPQGGFMGGSPSN